MNNIIIFIILSITALGLLIFISYKKQKWPNKNIIWYFIIKFIVCINPLIYLVIYFLTYSLYLNLSCIDWLNILDILLQNLLPDYNTIDGGGPKDFSSIFMMQGANDGEWSNNAAQASNDGESWNNAGQASNDNSNSGDNKDSSTKSDKPNKLDQHLEEQKELIERRNVLDNRIAEIIDIQVRNHTEKWGLTRDVLKELRREKAEIREELRSLFMLIDHNPMDLPDLTDGDSASDK